jgi:hypothetical protein
VAGDGWVPAACPEAGRNKAESGRERFRANPDRISPPRPGAAGRVEPQAGLPARGHFRRASASEVASVRNHGPR